MIDISSHPVWTKVNPFKKRGHLARIALARFYTKFFPREKYIGVTGSVGKTTTVNACIQVISQRYNTLTTIINLDPIFNIPITLLKTRKKNDRVILEMGIEYPGEMEFYLSLVRPATAIVTRIYIAHSEFLGNVENIAVEKGKLVEQLPKDGYAILNYDDILVRKMAEKTNANVVYFGTDPKHCHVWAGNIRVEDMNTVFELNYGVERVEVTSKLLGLHQIVPMLAAATLGVTLDIPLTVIKKGLERIEAPEHRLQALAGFNGSIILDDTYNAAPIAVEEALETLNHIPARRRIVVLGEMRELGNYSEEMHRNIARKIYKDKIDLVVLGQGDANFIADELKKLGYKEDRIFSDLQNPQIVSNLLKVLNKGDLVLIKGARANRLDEVVKKLIKLKGTGK